ncbi:MAG: glycosyltransferase [Coriobacteriia bacterium]|nr:glycosyltransferase [Coriobacteriia bacterium]MBN2822621.1 glycosyltransferase [Coriobacteriia bacterium]
MVSVIALVPAFNESERITATVRSAMEIAGVDRVLVVDDASSDDTSARARAAGAEVLTLPSNLGKGAALDAGLAYVAQDADILLLLDGDLAETAFEGESLLAPVVSGEADMTIATFPHPVGKAGFGLVKGLARFGIARLGGGFLAEAPLSGQRALSRTAWTRVTPFAFGYGVEVALTIRALRSGLTILEVPTTMSHAATGRDLSGFMHRGRQFAHVLRALIRLAFERTPTRD